MPMTRTYRTFSVEKVMNGWLVEMESTAFHYKFLTPSEADVRKYFEAYFSGEIAGEDQDE